MNPNIDVLSIMRGETQPSPSDFVFVDEIVLDDSQASAQEIIANSATGNIYHESFRDDGKTYHEYAADCAVCGKEIALDDVSRRNKSKQALIKRGWKLSNQKWVCPQCVQKHNL